MDEKQIREAFEQVAKKKNWNLAKGNCGWYVSAPTHEAWQGFLACYQHLAEQQKDTERLNFVIDSIFTHQLRRTKKSWSMPRISNQDWFDTYPTAREAIDAALDQQKEKQQC
ncbi:hypothetical protein PBR31_00048 [Xanthomonas phage PBR31]|uniref:Uncharacterized protein n=1 Tax=Xanthomonas phage PPDBI TaxID=2723911 RepID=A0A6H0X5R8_9CAUD|nr:hypothetical protein [Ralstonia pickettii]NYS09363.1 hypothetical protein [Ralstonia pickettii]QIN95359.1 hypothetical protein PBR31_00048 [Xanthomonas phage PBR31]QIW89407.1 hypothetical protein PPDBI_00048 [Xanthomonas phage PPDBI]